MKEIENKKWFITVNNQEQAIAYKNFFDSVKEQKWMFDITYIYGWNGEDYVAGFGHFSSNEEISFEQFKKDFLTKSSEINNNYSLY